MALEVLFYTAGTLYGVLSLLLLIWGEGAKRVQLDGEPPLSIPEGGSIAVGKEPVRQQAA